MKVVNAPFCMDSLRINNEGQSVEIPFRPSDDYLHSGHIPLTKIRLGGLDLAVIANANWPQEDKLGAHSRLDLYPVKNGAPFRVISHGPMLLCDESPDSEPRPGKFWIQYGAWE